MLFLITLLKRIIMKMKMKIKSFYAMSNILRQDIYLHFSKMIK